MFQAKHKIKKRCFNNLLLVKVGNRQQYSLFLSLCLLNLKVFPIFVLLSVGKADRENVIG